MCKVKYYCYFFVNIWITVRYFPKKYAYTESISNSPYLDDKIKRNKKILAG